MSDTHVGRSLARRALARSASEATGWRTFRRACVASMALVAVLVMVPLVAIGSAPGAPAPGAAVGVPQTFVDAFVTATAGDDESSHCGLTWSVLAAIAQVESGNGAGHSVSDDGVVTPPVIGPPLDGSPGVMAIADTDGGSWDGDRVWDRAVGPLQFIPGTWRAVGRDGNGDGESDPNNIFDAAASAAALLCAGGADLTDPTALHAALLRYNRSDAYAAEVESWIARFDAAGDASAAPAVALGEHALPVDRTWFAARPEWFSSPHHDYPAVDLPVPIGTALYAATSGRVRGVSGVGSRCGLGLVVAGEDGWDYVYCHASEVLVDAGATVAVGDVIARSGNTGRSTGPHLHFGMQTPAGLRYCPHPFLRHWYDGDSERPVSLTRDCVD